MSTAILTAGIGLATGSRPAVRAYGRVAPALGCLSLAFGVWCALGALELAPYAL